MSKHATPDAVIELYFSAMRRGPDGLDALVALFHDDAEYTEPFDGKTRTHRGKAAIEEMLNASMAQRPPSLQLHLHQVNTAGNRADVQWSCESPAFPAPIHGRDHYVVEDGKIRSLTTSILG